MRVLLIEDNELLQRALQRVIKSTLPQAVTDVVDTSSAAIHCLGSVTYDFIVSDFDLRIGTGGDVLHYVRERFPFYIERNRFILMSGDLRPSITELGHRLTFEKPIATRTLRTLLEGAAP